MLEPFETFTHAGMTCELHQDEDPQSPEDWDQLGTLVMSHDLARNYSLSKHTATGTQGDAIDRGGAALLVRYLRMAEGGIAVPFRFEDYGSSGARIYAASPDEDNPSGFIFTTPERCAELGVDVANAEQQLRAELEEWDAYVEGRIVGYVVRDSAGSVVDSVWGFYPDDSRDGLDDVRAEARASAEFFGAKYAEDERKLNAGRAALIRSLRLEYLRRELRAERISYGELGELQGLAEYIDPSDVELREAAGLPEFGNVADDG